MSLNQGAFLLVAILALGVAVRIVVARQAFCGALWLTVAFFGVAAIYLFLASPFIAGFQLFVYIGGVAVLDIIAIMVAKGKDMTRERGAALNDPWLAGGVAVSLFGVMAWMIVQLPLPATPVCCIEADELQLLGAAWLDPQRYLLVFEVISVMLLVTLVGSLYLGRER
jgi:NADH:ubiquinone oxidoreductase subunit 6 (subunit J)